MANIHSGRCWHNKILSAGSLLYGAAMHMKIYIIIIRYQLWYLGFVNSILLDTDVKNGLQFNWNNSLGF